MESADVGLALSVGLAHAATMLVASDVERSVTFYRDRLGFEELAYPHISLLRCGNLYLHLVEVSPPTTDKPHLTLAPPASRDTTSVVLVFEVADLQHVYQTLSSRGCGVPDAPATSTVGWSALLPA